MVAIQRCERDWHLTYGFRLVQFSKIQEAFGMKTGGCLSWLNSLSGLIAECVCLVALVSPVMGTAQTHLRHGVNVGRFLDGTLQNADRCCKPEDIRLIKQMGFDHIRILVELGHRFDFTLSGTIAADSFTELDRIVGACVRVNMGVVLAIALDDDRFKDKLGKDDVFARQFVDFWRSFAKHYSSKEFPPELIFFEVKNEPGLNEKDLGDAQWSGIQARLVAAIRDSTTKNTIIVTGAQNSDILGLLALPPLTDDRLIYVFHYYEPYSFTHQGEDWNESYAKFLMKQQVKYPYVAESARTAAEQVPDLTQRLFALHDMEGAARDRIESDFYIVAEWAKLHRVTVICDEFGVFRAHSDPKDRAQWILDVRTLLEKYGFGWSFWDYSSEAFGLSHAPKQIDEPVVKALGMTVPSTIH
jgi:endoglucanase